MNKELKDLIVILLNIISGIIILSFSLIGLLTSISLHNNDNTWTLFSILFFVISISIIIMTLTIKKS